MYAWFPHIHAKRHGLLIAMGGTYFNANSERLLSVLHRGLERAFSGMAPRHGREAGEIVALSAISEYLDVGLAKKSKRKIRDWPWARLRSVYQFVLTTMRDVGNTRASGS